MGPRRLAELSIGRPGRVLVIWAAVVVVAIGLIGVFLGDALTPEGDFTGNPESKQARELIDERLPERDAVNEIVVVRSQSHETGDPAFAEQVTRLAAELRETAGVEEVVTALDPGGNALVSEDGRATIMPVTLVEDEEEEAIEEVVEVVERADGEGGFEVDITGLYTAGRDFERIAGEDLTAGEVQFGLPAAMVILLLVFGTLVGAAIPLTMALISIIVALALVGMIGQAFELNLFVVNMLVAMGLALGIDYSLFIVSRLREERSHGLSHPEAILNTASTATRAVVFSGTAFSLALLGMFLVPDTVLRSLAVGAIVVALVSMVVALTFHPALLMVLGDRVDRLRVPWLGKRVATSAGTEGRFWGAIVRGVMRRPALSLAGATLLLLLAAVPLLGLSLGASGVSSLPEDTRARQGQIALERDFPAGATTPVEIAVDTGEASAAAAGLDQLRAQLADDSDFDVRGATVEEGPGLLVASVPLVAEEMSPEATAAVDRLRDVYVPNTFGDDAASVLVGGDPAERRDYFALIGDWLPIVIAFVLALSFVLLMLAFRSIVVPLTAILVNLLSVGAAYGLLVLVFQEGIGASLFGFGEVERIEAWVPVFLFSVLFGLSMDYQVFLLSRIRERYTQSRDNTDAITFGVGSTARLITGAALIIVVVFAGFATGELVAFQQMGFGVAAALLIDATIVRSVVIPAAMRLLGERNWYLPAWLSWLPRVEIEASESPAAAQSQRP